MQNTPCNCGSTSISRRGVSPAEGQARSDDGDEYDSFALGYDADEWTSFSPTTTLDMGFLDEGLDCSSMDFSALAMEGDLQKELGHGATSSSRTGQVLQFPPSSIMQIGQPNSVPNSHTCTDYRRDSGILVSMLPTPASTQCCRERRTDLTEVAVHACELHSLQESPDQKRRQFLEGTSSKSSSFDLTSIYINPTYLSKGATQATDAEAVMALIQLSQKIREYFQRSKPASIGGPLDAILSDSEQVNIWIKASLRDSDGLRTFIDWPFAEQIVKKELSNDGNDPAVSTLFYAIMTIGIMKENNSQSEEARTHSSNSCFTKALECGRKMLSAPNIHEPRIIDLQTLITLAYCAYSRQCLSSDLFLGSAVQVALALHLNSNESLLSPVASHEDLIRAQRAFWFLYIMEKSHSMRLGRVSMLDDAYIDCDPQIQCITNNNLLNHSDANKHLSIYYKHAQICSAIVKSLYSRDTSHLDSIEIGKITDTLYDRLEAWKKDACEAVHEPIDLAKVMCCYHEATFVIHGKWHITSSGENKANQSPSAVRSLELCQQSVSGVVEMCWGSGVTELIDRDCPIIFLSVISACILFHATFQKTSSKTDMGSFGTLLGFLARMSGRRTAPFNEISALWAIATKPVRRNDCMTKLI
ncbi:hypothetical protein ACMFMF_007608 [Clarireedia jacksonii]